MASIMEVLTKTAVAEITKLVDDGSAALRLEMCRSQRENEALKRKLLQIERERASARGYGEGAPDNSLNIALEVQFCDEFREAPTSKLAGKGRFSAVERVFDERLSTGHAVNDQTDPVEKKIASSDALDIKYEPVDGEQDWPESVLLSEDRLEEDPGRSQSQEEQKNSGANTCGSLGAAAAGAEGSAGPLCGEEELHMQPCPAGDPEKGLQAELKQEPEEEPLTPALPPLGSADWGLELQCAWSEAGGLGTVQEKHGQLGGSLEHRGAQLDDDFSPPQYRASQRLCLEVDEGPTSHLEQQQNGGPLAEEHSHGPPDDVSAEIPLPLGSPGEHGGSTPCEVSFDTSAEAKSHQTIEGQGELICTSCGKTFLDALQLKTHEKQHGLGKRFSCSECGKGFTSARVLEKHQRIHSRKKPFACSWCDKSFSKRHVLQEHDSIHTGLKPYVCTQCGKRFRHKGYLKVHQRVHTREKPFSCVQCGKCFKHMSTLKTHQITHTGDKPFSCTMCNKTFAYLHVLKCHQIVHDRENVFICKFCGKFFDSADSLKEHRLARHRGKLLSCTLCGKGFATKNSLNTHQRVHTGEKPYHCSECGKSFSQLGNLKSHQKVHNGEKPFSCTLCGKSFSHRHTLQRHIRTHSKETN